MKYAICTTINLFSIPKSAKQHPQIWACPKENYIVNVYILKKSRYECWRCFNKKPALEKVGLILITLV
jgi:hypothetical protein